MTFENKTTENPSVTPSLAPPASGSLSSSAALSQASLEVLQARQSLLEQEILANEEENQFFQSELNKVYAELDRRADLRDLAALPDAAASAGPSASGAPNASVKAKT